MKNIWAIDDGYGLGKWAGRDDSGEIIFGAVVSAYADAPDSADDMPLFEGKRYYTGDVALMEDSSRIKNITDYKDHETYAPLSIWNILNELEIDKNSIDMLGIGLSLAQKEYADAFIKRVSKFKINNELYDFRDKITLVPQGVSAKYAIDHYFHSSNPKQTYAIIDLGTLTVDVATVINGKVRRENANGVANEGIIKILQDIQELVADKFGEVLSLKEAQEILREGEYFSGQAHSLKEEIAEFVESYNHFITASLSQRYKNIFKKYPAIYFVGGGAYYVNKQLISEKTDAQESRLIIPENAEFMNAIGSLLIAEKELEARND